MLSQTSFEDLGTPLAEVTFCVIDLETTGSSALTCGITEIGALKVRRGEVVGTFHTLVDPGEPVPAFIRLLTGITDQMLIEAPPIGAVLPSLLEFVRNCVLVAHNARFDVSFINAALGRCDYSALTNRVVDTATLARKILAGEVMNNKLGTLAAHLRCAHRPSHRAFADAFATTDVLHHLIERVAGYGVTTLEDLLSMSFAHMDGTFAKIALARDVPPGIGVYRFVGESGRTLYVGKATDLRSRVRSYFYGDGRRRVRNLLRETQDIAIEQHATTLEAEVAEARAIAVESPPYNRVGKRPATSYLRVGLAEATPKIGLARAPKNDGSIYLGPFSAKVVRSLIETLQSALPIHRCVRPSRCSGCAFEELGRCHRPASDSYKNAIRAAAAGLLCDPSLVLAPLSERLTLLAGQRRYEEAAELRDRGALLERVIQRNARIAGLVDAGEIVLTIEDRVILIRDGQLAAASDSSSNPADVVAALREQASFVAVGSYLEPIVAREANVIAAWIERHAAALRIVSVDGTWALAATAAPAAKFIPRPA